MGHELKIRGCVVHQLELDRTKEIVVEVNKGMEANYRRRH